MNEIWLAILVAGAGTFALRASFLSVADRLTHLSPAVERVLRQIPPAVLAALVVPSLVRPEGELDVTQPYLVAGLIAAAVSWKTRSVVATLVVGMGVLIALQQLT